VRRARFHNVDTTQVPLTLQVDPVGSAGETMASFRL
jgi:hypothetical protein